MQGFSGLDFKQQCEPDMLYTEYTVNRIKNEKNRV
uniref:Uncharacterized protein n=1 Tax=Anguilla anguilla TaxID=7936 RepID=A0A0E9R5C0_ANGAN